MGDRTYSYDALMVLADGAAATTSAGIGQVSSANKILDLGGAPSRTDLSIVGGFARADYMAVIDVTALVASNTDDLYTVAIMGSNNADGSAPVNLAALLLGNFTLIPNGSTGAASTGAGSTTSTGRFELPFTTEQNNVKYEYIYLYVTPVGTSKSITLKCFVAPLPVE
jgi:hypothetical protein